MELEAQAYTIDIWTSIADLSKLTSYVLDLKQ